MNRVAHRAWLWAGLLLLCVAVHALMTALGGLPGRLVVIDVLPAVTAAGAAVVCGLAAARAGHRFMKWYWALLAIALGCSTLAETLWSVLDLTGDSPPAYPSLADAFWLLFYAFALAAVFQLRGIRTGKQPITETISLFDAVLFAIAGGGLCWEFLMLPVLRPDTAASAILISLSYPIADLLVVGALASFAATVKRHSVPPGTLIVMASFVVTFAADAAYTRLEAAGTYAAGAWMDPLWPLSYALLGIGAIVSSRSRSHQRSAAVESSASHARADLGVVAVVYRYSPYAAVLVAGLLSYSHFVSKGGSGPVGDLVLVVITTLIPIIVISRQLLLSTENRRLHSSLLAASQKLEERVAERTRELAAEKERLDVLNQAARDISGCVSVQDVLTVGAALLTRVKTCATVGVSASGSRGELQFASTVDTPLFAQRQLQRTLRKFLLSNAAHSDHTPVVLDGGRSAPAPSPGQKRQLGAAFASLVVFPVVSHGVMLGAACMASDHDDCYMSQDESELAENIVSQVGVALESVCRYDDARFLADSDALTGLANRRSITERLEQEVSRSHRAAAAFAIIMMDVDHFKSVNDKYGHAVGDQVLVLTARALNEALRVGDMVGRYGGDEFIAILPDTDRQGAEQVVDRIAGCLDDHRLMVAGGTRLSLHLSCGVAVYPNDGRDGEELLRVADANMYQAKRTTTDSVTSPTTA